MSKPKVIVTRRWPEEIEAELTGLYDVELNIEDKPMDADTLRTALGTADAVLPTVTDPINAEVLAAEPLRTRILGNFGVGFNHIDLEAAKARGITVTNTPEVLTDCTADIAMTLLLMSARNAPVKANATLEAGRGLAGGPPICWALGCSRTWVPFLPNESRATESRRSFPVVAQRVTSSPAPNDVTLAGGSAYATEIIELLFELLLDIVRERRPEIEPVLCGETATPPLQAGAPLRLRLAWG